MSRTINEHPLTSWQKACIEILQVKGEDYVNSVSRSIPWPEVLKLAVMEIFLARLPYEDSRVEQVHRAYSHLNSIGILPYN